MSLSLPSVLVTVIFGLVLCFSSSARMVLMAVGHSSHPGVYPSVMLSDPTSILACIVFILFGCQLHLSRATASTRRLQHFWFPMKSMISVSHFLAAGHISSQYKGSSMLLVAAIPVSSLRFLFLSYDSL